MNNINRIISQIQNNKDRYDFIDYVSNIIVYGKLDDVIETRNLIIEEFNNAEFNDNDRSLIIEALDGLKERIQELELLH